MANSDDRTEAPPISKDDDGDEVGPSYRRERRRFRDYIGLGSIFTVIAALLANAAITLPYYSLSPGKAQGVAEFVNVGDRGFPHEGDVLFTTVSLREAHPFDVIWAALLPSQVLEKKQEVSGDYSRKEYLELNNAAMSDSKLIATKVAMTRAGFTATTTGSGALVQQIPDASPVKGFVQTGEVIVAINDKPIALSSDLTSLLATFKPGAVVAVQILGNDKVVRTVDVTLGARPDQADVAYMGVSVSTADVRLDTQFPVSIDTTNVGGPSAGLAFTLALLDQLTPGPLTGGKDVAVTGTMSVDGTVGPVGGVVQKSYAVNKSDAKLFLVPSDEYEDARKTVDSDVKVVKVDTLQQAIDALAADGGDTSGVPAAPATNAS